MRMWLGRSLTSGTRCVVCRAQPVLAVLLLSLISSSGPRGMTALLLHLRGGISSCLSGGACLLPACEVLLPH